jgi:precorrin-2/cobalt-factor-2 C20-methyltransferase
VNILNKGTFFGVGVGPGDPELMTLKAARIMKESPVLAVPSATGESTTALDIAGKAMDLSGSRLLNLSFPMTTDKTVLSESHKNAAAAIIKELQAGNDVAMPTLGDPSIYSTVGYVAGMIEEAGFKVEIVPGVTSFCAAAALLKTGITDMDTPVHILPASLKRLDEDLSLSGTKIIMKYGKKFPEVREAIKRTGQLEKSALVKNVGMAGEEVCLDLNEVESTGYFSLIIVRE